MQVSKIRVRTATIITSKLSIVTGNIQVLFGTGDVTCDVTGLWDVTSSLFACLELSPYRIERM